MKNYNKKASNGNKKAIKEDKTIEKHIERAIRVGLDPLKYIDLTLLEYITQEAKKKKEKNR